MDNLLNEVQNYIDENKESVKEFDYINICNTMKELFEKKTSQVFYKVKYIKPVIISHSSSIFSVDMKQSEMIIKLNYKLYEKAKDTINTYGTYTIDLTSCNAYTAPFNKYFTDCHTHYLDCFSCEEENDLIFKNKTIIVTHIENA